MLDTIGSYPFINTVEEGSYYDLVLAFTNMIDPISKKLFGTTGGDIF
jgi:hypothetical protein